MAKTALIHGKAEEVDEPGLKLLREALGELQSPLRAEHSHRFFKTGKGEYAEDDVFLGITVPVQRRLAKKYQSLPIKDVLRLLSSDIHEERLIAIFILIIRYDKGTPADKEKIYHIYLKNTKHINNWDLVDASAYKIPGDYVFNYEKDISVLIGLAHSKDLWERRIAMISTLYFINRRATEPTLAIANILLNDKHDLIQKAVGWMLREMGKKASLDDLKAFLDKHHKTMPRTMLRYAIERLPPKTKLIYLKWQ